MKQKFVFTNNWKPVYANNNDALIPEVWAQESLMFLENNTVAANLVHRDFSSEIASKGDVVNSRRPANFTVGRKNDNQDVVVQDATSANLRVALDQHLYCSFIIKDGEESKGMENLILTYLNPAMSAVAQGLDEIVTGMAYQFLGNSVGKLGGGASIQSLTDAKKVMTDNKAPIGPKHLLLTSGAENNFLNIADFTNAEKVGDDGTAMREGSLGRKFGFNMFVDQNTPSVGAGNTVVTGAINKVGGHVIGDTTITVDGLAAAITNGSWFTVAGDMVPQRVISSVGGALPSAITFSPGLKSAVADNAVITIYTPGAINKVGGYLAGETDALTVDGFTVAPQQGQMISFGSASDVYSGINVPTTTSILPNRVLKAGMADNAVVGIGPKGDYNFFFHPNAVSLVTRPLALPMTNAGALSAIAMYNGMAIRTTISYQGMQQGHLVTVDLLAGIEVQDPALGGVLFT